MFDRLIRFSVSNRLLIVLALVAALIGAWFILPKLNLDAFPDVTNVQVQVNTEAPGLAAKEVEQLITYPIEAEMYALPDVKEVRSISKTGLSVITVVFKEGVDIYFARQQVFQQLQSAKEEIPTGVGTPEIGPNTSGLGQVFQYILRADATSGYNAMDLRSLNDWLVKLLLLPIEGVTDVLSFGGEVRQYQVQINPDQLLAYQLTIEDVAQSIEANNRNAGGWYLDRGREQLVIRGEGWLPNGQAGLIAMEDIPLKTVDGTVIYVKDVAKVMLGPEIRQGAVSMVHRQADGQPEQLGEVVTGIVLKRMGANTKTTIDAVKERLPMIQAALPKGVTIEPIYDQSTLISKAVRTVSDALIQAFVLIFIILFLFLTNVRATLLVIASIPIAIGLALMAMAHWGLSANLMSLGGLAIVIGMLVDGAVVMVDNLFKHLSRGDDKPGGIALRIQEACSEVARPVFFAVLIIIVVFAPLFTLQGVEGKLFQPMAMSIVFAMIASLLVALFVVPSLASYLFQKPIRTRDHKLFGALQTGYQRTLAWSLGWPKTVLFTAFLLFIASLSLVPKLGTEFVPELEEGTLNIRVTLAPSSSLNTALDVAEVLEQRLMTFPEVTYVSSRVGRPELGGDPEPVSNIELLVGLKPVKDWTTASDRYALQQKMQEKLSVFPGILLSFSQPIATRVDELLSGVKAQLAVKLFGPDLDVLAKEGKAIEAVVKKTPGTRDVAMEQMTGEAQLVVRPDRQRLKRYGLTVDQVMSLVSDGIGGREASQIIQGNERYDINVRLAKPYRNSVEAINTLVLQSDSGAWIKLGEVADIQIESGPPQIRRDDVQRRVVIQANIEGRDMGSVVQDIERAIQQQVQLPSGYSVLFGGQFENQARAQARLMIVVPISIALIFLLLYFAFHSVGQACLILLNVPLALIGGIVALYITGLYLSVPGSIGFIALFGIAVLNGVVMVNAINDNRTGGLAPYPAVLEAATSRLRPVLMTALTSALGLIPLLYAQGIGSEIQRPLATVVVGGLVSSTLLTLYVLPATYYYFVKKKR